MVNDTEKAAEAMRGKRELPERPKAKKKGIKVKVWPFLVVLLIVIAAIAYFVVLPEIERSKEINRCYSLNLSITQEKCEMIADGNIESIINECLNSTGCADVSYYTIARVKKNPEFCDRIVSPDIIARCKNQVK